MSQHRVPGKQDGLKSWNLTHSSCLPLQNFVPTNTMTPPFFAEKPRMNNILTSATEPYDLSFSRSFQNLAHLPPSYESAEDPPQQVLIPEEAKCDIFPGLGAASKASMTSSGVSLSCPTPEGMGWDPKNKEKVEEENKQVPVFVFQSVSPSSPSVERRPGGSSDPHSHGRQWFTPH